MPYLKRQQSDHIRDWLPDTEPTMLELKATSFGCTIKVLAHEFSPAREFNSIAGAYLKDPASGLTRRVNTYVAPLAMKHLDHSLTTSINTWIDDILKPKFGFLFLDEYSETQAVLLGGTLDGLYKMYLDTNDVPVSC